MLALSTNWTECLVLLLLVCLTTFSLALDPYRALGVDRNSNEKDIKRAYRVGSISYLFLEPTLTQR